MSGENRRRGGVHRAKWARFGSTLSDRAGEKSARLWQKSFVEGPQLLLVIISWHRNGRSNRQSDCCGHYELTFWSWNGTFGKKTQKEIITDYEWGKQAARRRSSRKVSAFWLDFEWSCRGKVRSTLTKILCWGPTTFASDHIMAPQWKK